jgi:hypothetical protein
MNNGISAGFLPQKRLYIPDHRLWTKAKLITTTTSSEIVPPNVYRLWVHLLGGGGGGYRFAGAGAGYCSGLLDVVPGQQLPTITIGAGGTGTVYGTVAAAGGTTSFGTLATATGGAAGFGAAGGTGTIGAPFYNTMTYSGGNSPGGVGGDGGSAPGSPYGSGGVGAGGDSGSSRGGAGGSLGANALFNGTASCYIPNLNLGVSANRNIARDNDYFSCAHCSPLLAFANRQLQFLTQEIFSAAGQPGWNLNPGSGSYGNSTSSSVGEQVVSFSTMFGGGGGVNGSYRNAGNGGFGAGGGGLATNNSYTGGNGGSGCCILIWDEAQYV